MEKTVKFLGLIFDSKLNWNARINYIEKKCEKKRLNILRMISGQSWGAGKATLLTVYRALIRWVLDYGSITYNSTSLTNKLKLDRIQHRRRRHTADGGTCPQISDSSGGTGAQQNLWGTCKK